MKKILLLLFVCLITLPSFSQSDPYVYKDFYSGVTGAQSFQLNDHVNIIWVHYNNETFDVSAVNDKMLVLWKTTLKGSIFSVIKLGEKILAIASTEHSTFKGNNNVFKGYSIDPVKGAVLAEKIVYAGSDDYMTNTKLIKQDDNTFKLAIRQTNVERRLHVAAPGPLAIFAIKRIGDQQLSTRDITVVTINDNLDTIDRYKPAFPPGRFIDIDGNKNGDLFLTYLNERSAVDVYKYDSKRQQPIKKITLNIIDNDRLESSFLENLIVLPSKYISDILYYGIIHKNGYKDAELAVGKVDFSTAKQFAVTETFDKDHMKSLKKSFVPLNKKIDDVDFDNGEYMHLIDLRETADGILVFAMNRHIITFSAVNGPGSSASSGSSSSSNVEKSALINYYEKAELKTKFQQILPLDYSQKLVFYPLGIKPMNNKLYIVGHYKKNSIYGQLDLTSGNWDKMELLSKKGVYGDAFSDSSCMLWFANSFVVPYVSAGGMFKIKFNVSMQQNEY